MTFSDLVASSAGNLWRMKLRTFLTTAGVVIAIAAFVSMLSFGAGMQEHVAREFNELGLFSTIQVLPPDKAESSLAGTPVALDNRAIEALSTIPGVNLAYPLDAFDVLVTVGDSTVTTEAQTLPVAATQTRLFSRYAAGSGFTSDSAKEALVTEEFLKKLGQQVPDSILGRRLIVSVRLANVDSGIASVLRSLPGGLRERMAGVRVDSLKYAEYRRRVSFREVNAAITRFMDGLLNAKAEVDDTLIVRGIVRTGQAHIRDVIIPVATALRFKAAGFSDDPIDLLAAMRSGTFLSQGGDLSGQTYPRVTLDLDPNVLYERVRDSVKSLGFRTFSYAEEFKEIRRFFFYFNMVLGVIGLIALTTAALGIVNTMVMSILERTREIGVLKSLGADERDIRLLFLAESGMIGAIGATLGIVFGWLITRAASVVALIIMERQGFPPMELFAMPVWLIVTALIFGLAVSLAAGLYPAARAARVDPVQALRNE